MSTIRAVAKNTARAAGVLALLASPAVLDRWLIVDDISASEAISHASAESKEALFLSPRGQDSSVLSRLEAMIPRQKGNQVLLEEIPDRFVQLLLAEKPREPQAHVRQWFPRTFLWAPRLITDEDGSGTLAVTMPDALTDWSVVGMSLSAEGTIGGDALTLQTGLPLHAEIRAPDLLRVGDTVIVPVSAVNHTDAPRDIALSLGGTETPLSLGAWGSQTVPWRIDAAQAGARTLTARLGGVDTVEHTLQVVPAGLPEHTVAAGPVVSDLTIPLPADTARVQLTLLPAQEALVQAAGVLGVPEDSYDADLLIALGRHLGDDLLRQRGELALRAMGDDPEQRPRWYLEQQRPDGSWPVPSGAPLSRLLSLAAFNVGVADHPSAALRTSALLERHGGRIADPFSAAMVLGTGLVDSGLAEHLRGILGDAVAQGEDGRVTVTGPLGVRLDGQPASEIDVLAAAALVMPDLAAPIRATLAGALSPEDGWGDGLTGLLVFRALVAAPPVHEATTVHLQGDDGAELGHIFVSDGAAAITLDLDRPLTSLRLVVDGPVSPELSWRLASTRWTTTPPPPPPGLSGDLTRSRAGAVGEPVEIAVTVTVDPALPGATLRHDLPAGVVWVSGSATVGGAPVAARESGGRLTIPLPADEGGVVTVRYRAVPTLAGDLGDGGVVIAAGEERLWLGAGPRWRVVPPR